MNKTQMFRLFMRVFLIVAKTYVRTAGLWEVNKQLYLKELSSVMDDLSQ